MAIITGIKTISENEVKAAQVQGNLPDRPSQPSLYGARIMSAEEVKEAYDRLPKLIVGYYNALVESIGGMTGGELDKESLAGKILTGIREGHTLRELFCDVTNGQFADYLMLDDEMTLSEFYRSIALRSTQVGSEVPTSSTEGILGSLYFSLDEGALYVCVLCDPASGQRWTKISYGLASEETDGLMSASDKASLETMKGQIADLLYEPIAISSFTNNVNTVEIGSTVDTVTLSWKTNKTPLTLTLDGVALDAASTSHMLTGLGLVGNKSFTLKAADERGAAASRTTSVTFQNGVFYGVGTAEAIASGVSSLKKVLSDSKARTFTVTAGEGEYIWYILPKRLGNCSFKVGGFDGGFSLHGTMGVTNESGYTEDYSVYRSDNASLGQTTVTVS